MDGSKFLSQDERDQLETLLKDGVVSDLRNAAMLLTALHSGARAQELLALEWNDIDFKSGEIRLATLKGGKPRHIVVPKFVREALARLRESSPVKPFAISYQRLVEIWHLYRIVQKPFKSLRHSFAMRCYERTKDIRFVQHAMGHRSISNTMIYLEYQYSTQEFKKLMRVR